MGMFGKTANVEQEMKKVESEAISSIIDKSMSIKGEISFKGKARIDGTINGNIAGEHLILSESGAINGDVTVTSFNCYGKIEGNIKASMLTARKSCSINGKLEAGNLTVEPGAAIRGEIQVAVEELKTIEKPAAPQIGSADKVK
jgi:cytoskeletal protein CcmA (bactofilin family)